MYSPGRKLTWVLLQYLGQFICAAAAVLALLCIFLIIVCTKHCTENDPPTLSGFLNVQCCFWEYFLHKKLLNNAQRLPFGL
jgi:hypothetical protein